MNKKQFHRKNKQLFLIVSLFLFFFTITASHAQQPNNQRFSLSFENLPLLEAMKKVEEVSHYVFFYDRNSIHTNRSVSLSVKDASIQEVLKKMFDATDISFEISKRQILLLPAGQSNTPRQAVTGIVTVEGNEPAAGATIVVKGENRGTVTDVDGKFRLEVPGNALLQISYIGYTTQTVPVNGKTNIQVNLFEDSRSLEEVIVVGYGTVKKSNVTGSISSIKTNDLPKVANSSVSNLLSGKASGVIVQQQSAQPGGGIEIVIRGVGSVNAGNEPLYVVDGFPINNNSIEPGSDSRYKFGSRNPLSSINPNDIESIEILKDASSTAIYGARAANGVVLLTTKRGKEGKASVEFNASYSVQNISKYFDMLDATGFMKQSNRLGQEVYLIENNIYPYGDKDASLANGYKPKFSPDDIAKAGAGTDWWKEVTKQGMVNEYNLTISGGTANTKYLLSGNYFNQKGVVHNSDFKRFSGRINLDQKILDNLKVGISLNASYIDNGNIQLGDGQWENSGVLVAALQMSPLVPVFDGDGKYRINPNDAVLPNPVSYREIKDNTVSKRLMANSFVEWEVIQGLTAKATVGIDDKSGLRSNYLPKTFLYGSQTQGKAYKAISNGTDYLLGATLNYQKSFEKRHNFDVLIGYEYQLFKVDGFGTGNTKFFTDTFGSDNLASGSGVPSTASNRSEMKLASYFGRAQYNFKEKYLATFTLRRDGTSNFGQNKRWGLFPSLALAWRAGEEEFLKSFEPLSNLKLRLSYGKTGNSGIGDKAFEYYGAIGNYLFGNTVQTAVGKIQAPNHNLKWETTTEINLGLDFGFFQNKLSGSIEYFDRTVNDLLAFRNLPTYNNIETVADNIGATQLSGFEFQVSSINIDKIVKWSTNFNISFYKDRWKNRDKNVILEPWQGEHDPIRAIYGYQTDGVKQIGQNVPHMPNAKPGNLIYKDLNGYDSNNKLTGKPDGKIDQADQTLLGSTDPGMAFGIGNTFEYKGFDLNIFFYGMANRMLLNNNKVKFLYDSRRLVIGDHNQITQVADIFTADKPSTQHPGIAAHPNGGVNDFILEKADFIRLKNITLGYNFPRKWLGNKLDMRIYADIQNLFTITGYSGVDPETDSLGSYPNQKSFSIGVNVKF